MLLKLRVLPVACLAVHPAAQLARCSWLPKLRVPAVGFCHCPVLLFTQQLSLPCAAGCPGRPCLLWGLAIGLCCCSPGTPILQGVPAAKRTMGHPPSSPSCMKSRPVSLSLMRRITVTALSLRTSLASPISMSPSSAMCSSFSRASRRGSCSADVCSLEVVLGPGLSPPVPRAPLSQLLRFLSMQTPPCSSWLAAFCSLEALLGTGLSTPAFTAPSVNYSGSEAWHPPNGAAARLLCAPWRLCWAWACPYPQETLAGQAICLRPLAAAAARLRQGCHAGARSPYRVVKERALLSRHCSVHAS